ncbi:MAG TPA: response regulator [Tepidisphaeraceae bacterium]|jgi:two-component system response regulator TctD
MRNRSVLIVEDDRVAREALTLLLQRLGYQTSPVGSVADGLARLDGQDCAILDMDLPDGLGTHVLERIRTEGRSIRVAICTGSTDESLLAKAVEFGAEIVLRKPLDVRALLDWLNAAT